MFPDSLVYQVVHKKLLAIGEIHGAYENTLIYKQLIEKLQIQELALEWPAQLAKIFNKFFQTSAMDLSALGRHIGDGRINTDYLLLFRKLFKQGKVRKFIYFDDASDYAGLPSWNIRDKSYAKQFLRQYNPDVRTLIVAGNLHTGVEPFTAAFEKGDLLPMLYHVQRKTGMFAVCTIKYYQGSFYNFGVQNLGQSERRPREPRIDKLSRYTYSIHLPRVRPVDMEIASL